MRAKLANFLYVCITVYCMCVDLCSWCPGFLFFPMLMLMTYNIVNQFCIKMMMMMIF